MKVPSLHDLMIVGYGTALDSADLPTIVPPIFGFRIGGQRFAVFPPLELSGERVMRGVVAPIGDLARFMAEGRATRLTTPLRAQPDHELWVDQEMRPHYGPCEEVERDLATIAAASMEEARRLLEKGELDRAYSQAQASLNGDDRQLEPHLVQAAIHDLKGERELLAATREIVLRGELCTAESFSRSVADLVAHAGGTRVHAPGNAAEIGIKGVYEAYGITIACPLHFGKVKDFVVKGFAGGDEFGTVKKIIVASGKRIKKFESAAPGRSRWSFRLRKKFKRYRIDIAPGGKAGARTRSGLRMPAKRD